MKHLALLFLLPLVLFATPQTLFRFGGADALQAWKCNSGATVELRAWPNGEPGLTGFFTYPASDGWPSAKLDVTKLGITDWRSVKTLSIEIYCPAPCHPYVEGKTATDKAPFSWYDLKFSEGRHTMVLNIEDKSEWDLSHVTTLDLFASQPKAGWSYYVGDITLEMKDPAREAAECKAAFAELRSALAWRMELLGDSASKTPAAQRLQQTADALPETPSLDELDSFRKLTKELLPEVDRAIFRKHAQMPNLALQWCLPEEKIHFDDYAFLAPMSASCAISAARGEGESAQLVGYAMKDIAAAHATLAGAPVMADGTELPLSAVTLSPVGYLETLAAHYVVDYVGYWPDPILEYLQTSFPIETDRYQSWWLEVQVPQDQKPGLYKGQVKVAADGAEQFLPYEILVRDFALPDGVPYFCPVPYNSLETHPATADGRRQYKAMVADMLIRHRMQPDDIYYGTNQNSLNFSFENLRKGTRFFNLGYVNRPITDQELQNMHEGYLRCKAEGVLDHAYIYCFDEATADRFPMIRETLLKVREACPGVPIYTTLYDGTFGIASNLDDCIDGWIPGTPSFAANPENIAAARARGRKVGWYVACSPYLPYANFLLEYPAMAPRLLMGFMAKKMDSDNVFLYYASSLYWEWTQTPEGLKHTGDIPVPMTGGPVLHDPWNGRSFQDFNGDGRLVYPGAEAPIPSMRLKYIRDGIEDAMYLDLLRKELESGTRSPEWTAAAEKELQIEDELVTNLTVWSRDPRLLRAKRERIARLLEEH